MLDKWVEYFEYLDTLRLSGVTNMYGAGSWLTNAFDIDRNVASKVLSAWMDTFDAKLTAEERAEAALARNVD